MNFDLSMTVFICHFIPTREVIKGIACLYYCAGYFAYLSASVFWFIPLP